MFVHPIPSQQLLMPKGVTQISFNGYKQEII
jgi:hypothetical protein